MALGHFAAPRAQRLEHRLQFGGQVDRRGLGAGAAGLARAGLLFGVAPQHQLAFALEHGAAALGQGQGAVALVVDGQQALRQQLAQHAAPGRVAQVFAHAEHAQGFVAVLLGAVGDLAAQDVDDVAGAVALAAFLPEAVDGRQHLLRGHGAVPGLGRIEADVAIAAGRDVLAEIRQQPHAAAFHGFAQPQHGVQLLAEAAAVGVVAGGFVDHAALLHHVLQAIGQPGGGGQAVAAGAAGFLVVALDRLGQVDVGHEAHVGLVDAHAEGDGGDHDHAVLAQEARLVGGPHLGAEPGVVRHGVDALVAEEFGGFLDPRPRQRVDHAGFALVLGADHVQQLLAHLVFLDDAVADVGAVETGDEVVRVGQRQALGDLGAGLGGGGGRQRDTRHIGPALVQHRQAQVFRAEIVAPLRDAVGLVDGEQRDVAAFQQLQAAVGQQALGRHVQQVQLAGQESLLDVAGHAPFLRRVEEGGAHAEFGQRVDLVLHQRDQG
ncbi:Uncharacterised protein [Achromobacter sp. 2789STDY5608628]|nr:Uncharacterised protein [Achromobacter sp. 2789STDY5608628]